MHNITHTSGVLQAASLPHAAIPFTAQALPRLFRAICWPNDQAMQPQERQSARYETRGSTTRDIETRESEIGGEVETFFKNMLLIPPDWAPDSIKTLFQSATLAGSAKEVEQALQGDKRFILWHLNDGLLLSFEKTSPTHCALKLYSLPNNGAPALAGGLFSLYYAITQQNGSLQSLSEWTEEMKTKVDPLAISYAIVPNAAVSLTWLAALSTSTPEEMLSLLLPLEEYREEYRAKEKALPSKQDEKGYKSRFITKTRGQSNAWWFYKAWMRPLLPEEDYKRFHFVNRYCLNLSFKALNLEKNSVAKVAAKLLRSLHKGKFPLQVDEKDAITEKLVRCIEDQPKSLPTISYAEPLMPNRRAFKQAAIPNHRHLGAAGPSGASHRLRANAYVPNGKQKATAPKLVRCEQWHKYELPQSSLPPINDPTWILQGTHQEKLAKIQDLTARYRLLSEDSSLLQHYKGLLVFKSLLSQIDPKLSESICLLPYGSPILQSAWYGEEEHQEFLHYYNALTPKENAYIYKRNSPQNESLAATFLCVLENKELKPFPKECATKSLNEFSKLMEEGGYKRVYDYDSSQRVYDPALGRLDYIQYYPYELFEIYKEFPNAVLWLNWLSRQLNHGARDLNDVRLNPKDYLAESRHTEKELFSPLSSQFTLTSAALPYTAPLQALINYKELPKERKYAQKKEREYAYTESEAAQYSANLLKAFFQEAWQTEALAKQYVEGQRVPTIEVLQARGSGTLPWITCLQNPQFQAALENFLQEEIDLHFAVSHALGKFESHESLHLPITTLLKLSARAARYCPSLKTPDFESIVLTFQERLRHLDESYSTTHLNTIKKMRLYLFLLLAEQKDPRAQQYRPLNTDDYNPERHVDKRILHHLKTLPDVKARSLEDPVQCVKEPFDWNPWLKKTFGEISFDLRDGSDKYIGFDANDYYIYVNRKNGQIQDISLRYGSMGEYDLVTAVDQSLKARKLPPICFNPNTLIWKHRHWNSYLFLQKGTFNKIGEYWGGWHPTDSSAQHVFKAPALNGASHHEPQVNEQEGYPLPTKWWTGETVILKAHEDARKEDEMWALQDRPHLYWRAKQKDGIHNNELVEVGATSAAFHVFHLPGQGASISFSIAIENGNYAPKEIEEYLCLLFKYAEVNNLEEIWKLTKALPLIPHRLSDVSKQLIQAIMASLAPNDPMQFDRLGIAMQLLEKFHTWFETPSLEMAQDTILPLSGLCLQAYNLYRDVHQNIPQEFGLTSIQRNHLSGLYPQTIKEMTRTHVEEAIPIPFLQKKIKAYIKRLQLAYQHVAIKRNVKISNTYDTQDEFAFRDEEIREARCLIPNKAKKKVVFRLIALRIAYALGRKVGLRYVWKERVVQLHAPIWIPQQRLSHEEKARKRLEIAATKEGGEYRAALIDYALKHNLIARPNETVGAFLARVEQVKHTKNILQKLGQIIRSVYRLILKGLSVYRGMPHKTKSLNKSVREPFELYRRHAASQISVKFAPTLPIRQDERHILDLANRRNRESYIHLLEKLEQKVEWSHLEGLFLQNGMRRLREINPTLSDDECDQIDALMHTYYIDPDYTYTAYVPQAKNEIARALLVFEKTTKLKVWPQQVEKLTTFFTQPNIAMQMAMGEGKTSVITSLMLILGAKPGRISMYMPPAAQFTTLATMLTRWQKVRFQQEVIPIHMNFATLHELNSLEWLRDKLLQAKELGHAILLHPDTAHYLKICYRSVSDPECLKVLFEIRKELKTCGDIIIDELDQILDPLKDTSLAAGEAKKLTLQHLRHFEEFMILHQRDPHLWDAICRNAPQEINVEVFKAFQYETIAPLLADKFMVPAELRDSFCLYIVGRGESPRDDAIFKWIHTHEEKDAIANHKHWIEDILHFTILRERQRHYGRGHGIPAIVSYNGVSCPTTMKFAQLGEEISYYFLNTLSSHLEMNTFKEVLETFTYRFKHFQIKNNRHGTEKVSKEFEEMTGVDLNALIDEPELSHQALHNINKDPFKKLRCEVYIAHRHITYYESQLTSTSQDLFPMFSTHRGFSGTFPGFVDEFDHTIHKDFESDESVRRAIRAHNEPVLSINAEEGFFSKLAEVELGLGGYIDSGALFREKTNRQVAEQVLRELPHIETVIFFDKRSDQEEAPDTPCIMKRLENGGVVVHVVGSTELSVLTAWGVKLETLFAYFDQRHCEGTDIKQLPNRCNAISFGLRTTERDLLQGIMRMRGYKHEGVHQRAIFVIENKTKEKLFGESVVTGDAIIEKSKEIEKEETARRSFRTYFHRIDAALFYALEEYMEKNLHKPNTLSRLRKFFEHMVIHPSAYLQFGGICKQSDPVLEIKAYRKSRQQEFAKIYPKALPKKLIAKLKKIEAAAIESAHFPEEVSSKKSNGVGQAQQQEQQVEQATEQEQVRKRILPSPGVGKRYKEKLDFKRVPLSDHYSSKLRRRHLISKSFEAKLFKGLNASQNFLHTYKTAYPLNHPDQKRATYLLLERKEGKMVATVLAGYDFHNYSTGKKALTADSCICLWRPSKEGHVQILQGVFTFNAAETRELNKIRMQIAFLNGNASYIADHRQDLLTPIEDLHIRFLRKRVEYWGRQELIGGSSFKYTTEAPASFEKTEVLNLLDILEEV